MPAPHLTRRSARLQALTNSPIMASGGKSGVPSAKLRGGIPATQKKRRGRGSKSASALTRSPSQTQMSAQPTTTPGESSKKIFPPVAWDGQRTDLLVEWITTHVADRNMLCHDSRGASSASKSQPIPGDRRSGKNKKDITCVIAKHIFGDDPEYSELVILDLAKLGISVTNRLQALKTKYREHRAEFKGTGGGVMPDGIHTPADNLLESVLDRFPHYLTLHSFWEGIPSFDNETVTSHPGVDHSGSFLEASEAASVTAEKALDKDAQDDDSEVPIINQEPEGHWHQDQPRPTSGDASMAGFDIDIDEDHQDERFDMDLDLPPAIVGASDTVTSQQWTPASRAGSSKLQGKAPMREGRSLFAKRTPYSRSPSTAGSAISKRSLSGSAVSSTRMTSASASMSAKLEELGRASDLLEVKSSSSSRTAMHFEYAIRKKELELKEKELQAKRDHDAVELQKLEKELQAKREQSAAELQQLEKSKQLDLQILDRRVQLAEKQIEYVRTMKTLGMPLDPSIMGSFQTHEGPSNPQAAHVYQPADHRMNMSQADAMPYSLSAGSAPTPDLPSGHVYQPSGGFHNRTGNSTRLGSMNHPFTPATDTSHGHGPSELAGLSFTLPDSHQLT